MTIPSYVLTRPVFDEKQSVAVTADAFAAAQDARRVLLLCLGLEERFNILLENYKDLESELLNLALCDHLFRSPGWSERVDELQLLNRRVTNLLTICRMYLDHTPQTLNDLFGTGCVETPTFVEATSTEYDDYVGYRALEALRNYVQHRALPIHSVTHKGRWADDGSMLEHWVIPTLNLKQIRDTGGFKATVLGELEELPQPIDLRMLVREYMTSFRTLHGIVRRLTKDVADRADQVMEGLAEAWAQAAPSSSRVGLELQERSGKYDVTSRVPVMLDIGKRRRYLQSRNRLSGDFAKQVVTNRLA